MTELPRPSPREPAVHELAAQVLVQMGGLAGQEFALAKAELHARARSLGIGSTMLAAGGFIGVSGRRIARAVPLLPLTTDSIRRDVREIREKAWR